MLAQLRNMLAAKDSAVVAKEHDHRRAVRPQSPELNHAVRCLGKMNRRQACAERIGHTAILRRELHSVNLQLSDRVSLIAMPDAPDPDKRSFFVSLARYSQLAFVLPAATATGWIVGVLLDRWLHTTWIYLVGLLLGIAAGFVELVRAAIKSEKAGD